MLSDSLAANLISNLQVRLDRSALIMTAPFADLHDVKNTSPLGRILAEELGNAFTRHGYRLADTRVFMPSPYSLKEQGETALSSAPDQVGATSGVQTILSGTYAMVDGGLRISARLVRPADHAVLAAASCRLRLTEEVRELLAASSGTAKVPAFPATLMNLKTKADAKLVQQALAAQGLYKGKIDGLFGKRSKAALSRFRASMALPATPAWDLETQAALLPTT
ncbi:MAG: peptidoglycan-binding protein [Desulfomicrobium sp.]|nr:peptidoglycan-binding protein [Pseudomonadota bacterium]MBU4571620.1 peptidoglycan-binding protein [Pseudomonadota bacterium]MBU4595768.1 peptidoglycan-binding protein [Pseudomonadota bacterium]MBV1721686.1 peptidoglycan-binding protein [Desulfomicrobium sp.]MBV1747731.1 peptidoglycan-binding protein [Desulfomicrobium sp.]